MNLRDKILAAKDIESQMVEVPEWDVTVEMRTPTVRTRGELIAEYMGDDAEIDYVRMYPALLVATAHDPETGDPLFTAADIDALAEKSAAAVERLGEVAVKMSGMEDAAKRIDAGKADSKRTRNGSTRSG